MYFAFGYPFSFLLTGPPQKILWRTLFLKKKYFSFALGLWNVSVIHKLIILSWALLDNSKNEKVIVQILE